MNKPYVSSLIMQLTQPKHGLFEDTIGQIGQKELAKRQIVKLHNITM